jgi:hypothetical protein
VQAEPKVTAFIRFLFPIATPGGSSYSDVAFQSIAFSAPIDFSGTHAIFGVTAGSQNAPGKLRGPHGKHGARSVAFAFC